MTPDSALAKLASLIGKKLSPGFCLSAVLLGSLALSAKWRYCRSMTVTEACQFAADNQLIVAFVVVISAILLGKVADAAFAWIAGKVRRSRSRSIETKRLSSLESDERAILREFVLKGVRSLPLPIESGTVGALERFRLIVRTSRMSSGYPICFDFSIAPWAMKHLRAHPHLVDLTFDDILKSLR